MNFENFVIQFFPRLTLVAVIELFSYFFLRLYKQAIDEIRYFQNEITNIELKLSAAVITQKISPTKPNVVISALAATERNFLVSKDKRIVAEAPDFAQQTAAGSVLEKILSTPAPTGKPHNSAV